MASGSNVGAFGEAGYYPPLGLYFSVEFDGKKDELDSKFSEVGGMSAQLETQQVPEGGENRYQLKLPKNTSYSDLVLKRGVMPKTSSIAKWCNDVINNNYYQQPIKLQHIILKLKNEDGQPLIIWKFWNAYPKKLELSSLNAQATGNSAIVIETISFAYTYFERFDP